ncbi:hypothetical protein [Microbacterium sp. SORGH_AS_0862]|uniref:hypothetical protein n=1 Tax=Microbacterium sp. SORGH_AS_0862 TaxID=3041789 RepID=UPI002793D00A|nr:hypothetical protein [Microbacterium sp. SORGH_AS_0862]MDQ1206618.1 hypothetical protein [Microbacterium sp. SORGH_AS_0862]
MYTTNTRVIDLLERPPGRIDSAGANIERYDFSNRWVRATVDRTVGERVWHLNVKTDPTNPSAHTQDQVAKAIEEAAAAVRILNKPTRSRLSDDALSLEVRTLITDRGWTFKEAAAEFGLEVSRVGNLLSGQTRWAVGDVFAVARAIGQDEWEEVDRLLGIARNAEE